VFFFLLGSLLQFSISSNLYVEWSVKGDAQQQKTSNVTIEWSFLLDHPWHIIYFRRFSGPTFKNRNRLRVLVIFLLFCSVFNELQYLFCQSGRKEIERKLWVLKAILRSRRVKGNEFIYHHCVKGKMHRRKEKKTPRDFWRK